MKIITTNKKAFGQYQILEKYEAGMVLNGQEIKAIRAGKIDLQGSFVRVMTDLKSGKPEIWVVNLHINAGDDPNRTRKLLMHKKEILKLAGKTQIKGLTLVPLQLYLKKGFAKLEIGLGKGLKIYDKREQIKKKEIKRKLQRGEL